MDTIEALKKNLIHASIQTALDSEYVRNIIDRYVGEYANVEKLIFTEQLSIEATVRFHGMNESITVSIREYDMAEDCSWVAIRKLEASAIGIERLLERFLVGHKFSIPERTRSWIGKLQKALKAGEGQA